jgi:hypothetical protein
VSLKETGIRGGSPQIQHDTNDMFLFLFTRIKKFEQKRSLKANTSHLEIKEESVHFWFMAPTQQLLLRSKK